MLGKVFKCTIDIYQKINTSRRKSIRFYVIHKGEMTINIIWTFKTSLSRLDMKTRGNQVMINNPRVWPAEPVTGFANTKHTSL